ncbi:DUF805 domain-containing protein [Diaminobutyricibacter sp. McL0618]|uniref:DUF805 domain-containing protein n=1 Tax=Leifsonia sp. McL0618 TaxID=3415677 RepID=UPI003CE9C7F0
MDDATPVPPTSTPAPGWYPDPVDGGRLRWWTGQGWSEHTQQHPAVVPEAAPAPAYAAPAYAPPAYAPPTYGSSTSEPYTPMAYAAAGYSSSVYRPIDPESQPLPGASIVEAFIRFWTKYARFKGRASRSEYWWWQLVFSILYLAAVVLTSILEPGSPGRQAVGLVVFVVMLAIIVPSWALTVRRLHDANLSAWNILWTFLPLAGGIVLIVLMCRSSDPAGARFD